MVQRRFSKQRQIIYDMIKSNPVHPTADYIYNSLKKDYPDLSLGTVYRNLNVLTESGLIIKITSSCNSEHYDGNTEKHYHLMCEECNHIFDVNIGYLNDIEQEAQKECSHLIKHHSLVFTGVCAECKMQNAKWRKAKPCYAVVLLFYCELTQQGSPKILSLWLLDFREVLIIINPKNLQIAPKRISAFLVQFSIKMDAMGSVPFASIPFCN